jgi:prokaryotic ubiquitin-like protein Pup
MLSARFLALKVRSPYHGSSGGSQMATKDTGGQKQTTRQTEEVEETQTAPAADVQERQEKLTDDVDAILDEIDEVLEENAEEFIRSYVQKGGE